MKFEVLLSCMNENDFSIIHKSNLDEINTLVINQCKTEKEYFEKKNKQRIYNTATRGLSVSRNLAIKFCDGDVCLLSDDDETFCSSLETIVLSAYYEHPEADIIIFKMSNYPCKLGSRPRKLHKYDLLRVSSWQISFKSASIRDKFAFDTKLGAGTPNGAGEENKFLLDCYEAGLTIYYVPEEIATVAQEHSTWFKGFDQKFFFNRGKTTRYILGFPVSVLYGFYYLLLKRKLYKRDISIWKASMYLFKGILAEGIDAKYE